MTEITQAPQRTLVERVTVSPRPNEVVTYSKWSDGTLTRGGAKNLSGNVGGRQDDWIENIESPITEDSLPKDLKWENIEPKTVEK